VGTLTGKTRYRIQKRFFRAPILVLQVQVTFGRFDDEHQPGPHWRDATVEDLASLNP
jgi:hypothetical protein